MKLTVLADNTPHPKNSGLIAKHGFAIHVEFNGFQLLYDFGPEGVLIPNASVLGIDLSDVNIAVLSHGHYDHSGGLGPFLEINDIAKVRHGRGAFQPRWNVSDGPAKDIGVQLPGFEDMVDRFSAVDKLVEMKDFIILPAAPGHRRKPDGNSSLLAGRAGERLQDDFTDELTVAIHGEEGLVVITGCSHRGIVNIVDQVKTYCPNCPITALIGGFHLFDEKESQESLERVVSELAAEIPDAHVLAGHCTGSRAVEMLSGVFRRTFQPYTYRLRHDLLR
jgi:7,8-dihydropterin-6-yl-methyl-4-(beta-D-ribofuranosyl)aminobenzene 5'-phosphate synthase